VPELEEVLAKYRQIANHFRDQILRGDLRPGDEIPSERMVATQFSVSRPTATKALELLRREGFAQSVQGSGTFVTDPHAHRRPRERYQRAREEGKIYPPDEFAVIVVAELVDPAPEHVLSALELEPGSSAIRRRRIINNATGPLEVSTSWFSGALAVSASRLLEKERIRAGTLRYVESVTGRPASYARDRVSARFATDLEARELVLTDGVQTPVLTVEHVICDQSDRPIEFAEAVYPPGRWAYEQQYSLT
jgi:DNA-binding GntR family transcriptional regulator